MPISFRALTRGLAAMLAKHQAGTLAGAREREERTERRTERDRAAMLSLLNERALKGQLEDRDTARLHGGERRRRITEAAAKLRANPRFKSLADLPDEELIDAASDLILTQTRTAATAANKPDRALQEAKAQLGTVERQVDDTRADLARVERDLPPSFVDLPLDQRAMRDSTAHEATRAPLARRAAQLSQRADSLGGVRDSLAAVVQQGGRDVPRTTKTPAQWVAEVRREHPDWAPEKVAAEARQRAGRLVPVTQGTRDDQQRGQDVERARTRALELQRQGKSRAEILRIMRAEGFDVQ